MAPLCATAIVITSSLGCEISIKSIQEMQEAKYLHYVCNSGRIAD
ncbi:hypothetical protein QSI_3338 [Clostridioides difficile P28]|nr:hypothetical protein QSI_3338 [Clostridioides difficile P28]